MLPRTMAAVNWEENLKMRPAGLEPRSKTARHTVVLPIDVPCYQGKALVMKCPRPHKYQYNWVVQVLGTQTQPELRASASPL